MLGIDGHSDDTGDALLVASYDGIIFNRFPGQMPYSKNRQRKRERKRERENIKLRDKFNTCAYKMQYIPT